MRGARVWVVGLGRGWQGWDSLPKFLQSFGHGMADCASYQTPKPVLAPPKMGPPPLLQFLPLRGRVTPQRLASSPSKTATLIHPQPLASLASVLPCIVGRGAGLPLPASSAGVAASARTRTWTTSTSATRTSTRRLSARLASTRRSVGGPLCCAVPGLSLGCAFECGGGGKAVPGGCGGGEGLEGTCARAPCVGLAPSEGGI